LFQFIKDADLKIQMLIKPFKIKKNAQFSGLIRKVYIQNNTTKMMKPAWPGTWYRFENADTLIDG